MLRVVLLSALVGAAFAGCPNSCSGHGSCALGEVCECQPRWLGADCSLRECAYGVSWVTSADTAAAPGGASYDDMASVRGGAHPGDYAFMGEGGRHDYTECSSKGACDRSTGECECFDGFSGKGCRRMQCPNDCSGNGMCMTNFEINAEYKSVDPDSQMWDWNKSTQCKCDPGFEGLDCSKRSCPVGDDPLTNCNAGVQMPDIQKLTWYASGGGSNGYFSLSYTDAMGANFTTRPIFAWADPETSSHGDTTAADIEAALENLPNFAVPNVTVTYTGGAASGAANEYLVTFLDDANAGEQALLLCSWTEAESHNHAGASPRFAAPDHTSVARTCTATHETATYYNPAQGYTYKDAVTCSNRGDCDTSSGTCECWEGFTGEACHEQTVFF